MISLVKDCDSDFILMALITFRSSVFNVHGFPLMQAISDRIKVLGISQDTIHEKWPKSNKIMHRDLWNVTMY